MCTQSHWVHVHINILIISIYASIQGGYMKNLKEINEARFILGLRKIKEKDKKCSRCGDKFKTYTFDIVCEKCKENTKGIFDLGGEFGIKRNGRT